MIINKAKSTILLLVFSLVTIFGIEINQLSECSHEAIIRNMAISTNNKISKNINKNKPLFAIADNYLDIDRPKYLDNEMLQINGKIQNKSWNEALSLIIDLLIEMKVYPRPKILSFAPLEHAICKIASESLQETRRIKKRNKFKKILHVASVFHNIGGHTRVARSFIDRDASFRNHSIILTRQGFMPIPSFIKNSKAVEIFNCIDLNHIQCAQKVRNISLDYDLVILHIVPQDAVSVAAFSCGYFGPHVAFFDHADHLPWLGSSVIDSRLIWRHAAFDLREMRRIEKYRNVLMPLPAEKTMNKAQARQLLNLSNSDILLLSMASGYKFEPNQDLIEMVAPILKEFPNVKYYAIGPSHWNDHIKRLGINSSQVMFKGSTAENGPLYHAAADIHIDSYPLASIVSLVESILDGGLAIGYCPWNRKIDLILCTDPADYGSISHSAVFSCPTSETFTNALRYLLSNIANLNLMQKRATESMSQHWGLGWGYKMNEVYEKLRHMKKRNRFEILSNTTGIY